ncbi:hypothetical protein AAFF_G00396890 [Aldrovandia affinis]|uniref:Uncharacterized protein n=1 Tax=Aldrovandia affinis TaxID=143900 RepID=A0AAD7SCY6_9TELE|nr:hypothetical protein AAFF_G00396890 [Aldrovandia affinis]
MHPTPFPQPSTMLNHASLSLADPQVPETAARWRITRGPGDFLCEGFHERSRWQQAGRRSVSQRPSTTRARGAESPLSRRKVGQSEEAEEPQTQMCHAPVQVPLTH